MAPAYSCPKCGHSTDSVGNYNKHINNASANPRRLRDACCVGNNAKLADQTWGKHVCLADVLLEAFEMQHTLFDAVCLELKSMPYNDFQQLGLASQLPKDVALAAFRLLCLNPKHSQHQILMGFQQMVYSRILLLF